MLVLWLAVAPPVTCQHGPMSLLSPWIQEDLHMHPSSTTPASAAPPALTFEAASRPCYSAYLHAIEPVSATLLTMALGLFVSALPSAVALPPLAPALSFFIIIAFARRRQAPLPPSDPPPRP